MDQEQMTMFDGHEVVDSQAHVVRFELATDEPLRKEQEVELRVVARVVQVIHKDNPTKRVHVLRPVDVEIVNNDLA